MLVDLISVTTSDGIPLDGAFFQPALRPGDEDELCAFCAEAAGNGGANAA